MSSTLCEARIHHRPYRARFFLRARRFCTRKCSRRGWDGTYRPRRFRSVAFSRRRLNTVGKALSPLEANLQVTLNALDLSLVRPGVGALAFVNRTMEDYLGLPSDHPLRFAADSEARWDAHVVFLHPEDQSTLSRNARTNTQICNGVLNATMPMMARTFELRRESNRVQPTAIRSEVYGKLSSQCRLAITAASARTIEEPMMWIDIGVTVLLTLRIALFAPTLPQLLDPNNDAWFPEGKDEQQECLFVVMEK
jgi:hypothetical protein